MFTGLIKEIGRIASVERIDGGLRYGVVCAETAAGLSRGASVSVDGICQTVTELFRDGFRAEAVASTLQKTTIGSFVRGRMVNLEPALRAGDALDGHILQGHVQQTGKLLSIRKQGIAVVLRIKADTGQGRGIIPEGSVGIDGISLTVASCRSGEFCVSIIPETWISTTLSGKKPGDLLNIEGDLLLRGGAVSAGLNTDKLREWGY